MNKKEKLAVKAIHGSDRALWKVVLQHRRNLIAKAVARHEQMLLEEKAKNGTE